jgi:hypothetical protein
MLTQKLKPNTFIRGGLSNTFKKKMGRNIYYPTIFGHILNRNNQKFIKFGKILKENFI